MTFIRFLRCLKIAYFTTALSVLFLETSSLAGLVWDHASEDFYPKGSDTTITGKIKFKNITDTNIIITNLTMSCGCATADIDKKTYKPGEEGTIEISYVIGNAIGLQTKSLLIQTDEKINSQYRLILNFHTPEPLTIEPRYLIWKLGDSSQPKSILVSSPTGSPVKILSVRTDSEDINATLKAGSKASSYLISVSPTSTLKEARSTITIETNLISKGSNRKFYAYADVCK